MPRFRKGSRIFHTAYGAGVVVGRERMEIGELNAVCFIVELAGGSTLMIPVSDSDQDRLQRLIDPAEVRDILGSTPEDLDDDFRKRRTDIETKISSGDQVQCLEALRDLAWRERHFNLSNGDKALYNNLKKRVAQVLFVALRIESDKADQLLDSLLEELIPDPQAPQPES